MRKRFKNYNSIIINNNKIGNVILINNDKIIPNYLDFNLSMWNIEAFYTEDTLLNLQRHNIYPKIWCLKSLYPDNIKNVYGYRIFRNYLNSMKVFEKESSNDKVNINKINNGNLKLSNSKTIRNRNNIKKQRVKHYIYNNKICNTKEYKIIVYGLYKKVLNTLPLFITLTNIIKKGVNIVFTNGSMEYLTYQEAYNMIFDDKYKNILPDYDVYLIAILGTI